MTRTFMLRIIVLSSPEYLQTVFAQNAYGHNVTEKTSEIAERAGAILAINGDYYGVQEEGYVLRNGVLYRSTAAYGQVDLVIYNDGASPLSTKQTLLPRSSSRTGRSRSYRLAPP